MDDIRTKSEFSIQEKSCQREYVDESRAPVTYFGQRVTRKQDGEFLKYHHIQLLKRV